MKVYNCCCGSGEKDILQQKNSGDACIFLCFTECQTPLEARQAILQLHYHKIKEGQTYLPPEQVRPYEAKASPQILQQEWSHLTALHYARVTKRLDKLLSLD